MTRTIILSELPERIKRNVMVFSGVPDSEIPLLIVILRYAPLNDKLERQLKRMITCFGFHEEYGRYYNLLQKFANVDETDREATAFAPWLNNMDECYLRFINLRDAKVTEDTETRGYRGIMLL